MRRYGLAKQKGQKYVLRPGVYAILPRGRDILLTYQSEPEPEFQLPGGGIDPGESALMALHREVLEETGWRIANPRRLGAFRRFTYMPEYDLWAEKLCTIYLARPIRRMGLPEESGHEAIWTSPQVAIKIVENDGDRAFLQSYYRLFGPL